MPDSAALRFLVKKRTTFTWIIPVGLLIATYFYGHWSAASYLIGALLLVLGEVVRFWAAGHIHKDDQIATDGPYGIVRNPLYFGSLLLAAGYTAMSGIGIAAWIVVIGLFMLFHLAAIISEERFLITKFGEPYQMYLTEVSRIIPMPRFAKRSVPSHPGSFSAQQALYNREHITATITVATAIAFLAVLRYARHKTLGL